MIEEPGEVPLPEARSWRESLLSGSALPARRPTPLSPALQAPACCPSPFLTLSSSPPAEAVVTAATNAVVLAAWSTPRPALRPLDPTRRPLGGGKGRRGAEEATEAKPGPEAPGRRGKVRRRAATAAPPHVHTGHSAPARSCRQPGPPPRCDLSPRPLSAPARPPRRAQPQCSVPRALPPRPSRTSPPGQGWACRGLAPPTLCDTPAELARSAPAVKSGYLHPSLSANRREKSFLPPPPSPPPGSPVTFKRSCRLKGFYKMGSS